MGRLIERLTGDPHGVRDALAAALGDPTLVVAYWMSSGFVDRDGHALAAARRGPRRHRDRPRGPARRRAGTRRRAVLRTPELLPDAAAAAALALENARLEVELRARLESLRASRARLVEAGDAERRRLGRDLHDGAQQRLVALMIELQLARERFEGDPAGARELSTARSPTPRRRWASCANWPPASIPPCSPSAAWMPRWSRSRALRCRSSRQRARASGSQPVETAAYFVVAEALTNVAKYAGATHARGRSGARTDTP